MKLIIIFILTILGMIFLKLFLRKTDIFIYKIYFLMLTICIPFNIGLGLHNTFRGEQYSVGISYIFVTIVCIVITSTDRYICRKVTFIEILFTLIFAFILINWFMNEIYETSRFIDLTIFYITFYLLFIIFKSLNREYKNKIISAFSYIGIINGILSIFQYITGRKLLIGIMNSPILYYEGIKVTKRTVGLAGTNNAAGNLSAILFSVCMYNYSNNKSKKNLIAVILTLVASALTLTRIGYVAIAVQIIIYLCASNFNTLKSILNKFKMLFLIVCPIIIIFTVNLNKIINILFLQRGNTQSYRFIQFNNIKNYIIQDVTLIDGIGLGQYRSYLLNNYGIIEIDLHNQYINILIEQGALVFIVFMIINIILLINAKRNSASKLEKALLMSLFVGNFICSNFNPNQYYYINNVIYIILLCCLTGITTNINKTNK